MERERERERDTVQDDKYSIPSAMENLLGYKLDVRHILQKTGQKALCFFKKREFLEIQYSVINIRLLY